jgi:signal transduction histidine kinase
MSKTICPQCRQPVGSPLPLETPTGKETASHAVEDPLDLQKILSIGNAVNSTLNLETVLNLVLDYSMEITQAQRGYIFLRQENGELEETLSREGSSASSDGLPPRISRSALDFVLKKGRVVATLNAQRDAMFSDSRSVFDLGLQTIVCLPLQAGRRSTDPSLSPGSPYVSGAIYLDSSLPLQYFTPHKQSLLEVMANSAATAIENARLYRAVEQQKTAIQAAADNLELLVRERTAELDQKNRELQAKISELQELQSRLVQSEKMATIGTLAGGVAHEINNPLGAMTSSVQRILRFPCNESRHTESARLIEEGARRCTSIVEKLLAYSRKSDSTLVPTNLNSVLESTLELLQHHFRIANIHLEKQYSPLPPTPANPNELAQVISNLLINAKDSITATLNTQKCFGTITLRTYSDERTVYLEVQDDGSGIPPEVLPRLFDPFYTTKGVGAGTGLGLYVSLGLMRRYGGNIEAESPSSGGACFRLILPRLSSPAGSADVLRGGRP